MKALLRSEWTKFRTVRGWVVAVVAAGAAVLALGLFPGSQGSCGQHGPGSECVLPVGPTGVEVTDSFTFVHQPLTGDGQLTVRVATLTGELPSYDGEQVGQRAGVMPWAKAGLIIKANTTPGSAYAAVMRTGGHGTRMQSDFTGDVAGQAGPWLRLTRAGDRITGEESADGTQWTTIAAVTLTGLPSTVEAGLFVTSPQYAEAIGAAGAAGGPTIATATFDHLARTGTGGGAWTTDVIGGHPNMPRSGTGEPAGDGFTVTGTGDIAPAVPGATGLGTSLTQTLAGTFIALLVVVVVAVLFITAEYRRGLIRTSLAASPHRGRLLAAKATVVAGVTFVVGAVTAAVVVAFGRRILESAGAYVHPAPLTVQVRLVLGTGALLAVAAVLGLAIGTLLRRGVTAVASAVVLIVLPYLLAVSVLPVTAAQWLLRVTPAAAFAVQQSAAQYAQVDNLYLPASGFFPLPPWAGFAVLVGWTAIAFVLASLRLMRSDV